MAFDPIIRAWLIPWRDGQLGIAYTTKSGIESSRPVRSDDPELPILRSLLTTAGQWKLDAQINNVVPFPQHLVKRAGSNDKAHR